MGGHNPMRHEGDLGTEEILGPAADLGNRSSPAAITLTPVSHRRGAF